jgi:sigma-B regulation protein RsbU (phosphoserine phosphatase)
MADITRLNWIMGFLGTAGVLLLSVAVVFIARSITRPLRQMAEATRGIAAGNLDIELPSVKSGDEVGKLSEAFQYMEKSLKEYIRELTETTASKERIESELKIAHDIQMSILPKIFPPFPDRKEFNIYALIEPAREVGGDFYDFFFIDHDHFCFVIGDVSGKGIPASLFMAVTKTLVKATAEKETTPGEILTRVNSELSQGNESCMFVTIFCGVLNIKTGEVSYANGGHNLPLVLRRDRETGFLDGKGGLVVGAMEDSRYETESFVLQPGESLFLYTDGVTEAMNGREELFSDERLKGEIILLRGKTVYETIQAVIKGIVSFCGGVPQSDDITMMMIQFNGEER